MTKSKCTRPTLRKFTKISNTTLTSLSTAAWGTTYPPLSLIAPARISKLSGSLRDTLNSSCDRQLRQHVPEIHTAVFYSHEIAHFPENAFLTLHSCCLLCHPCPG